jgi:hypothetical protein
MANWHALQGDDAGNQFQIAYHIPIPNVSNQAGPTPVSYRNCIVQAGLNTTVLTEGAAPGQITTAEKQQIDSGAIYEHIETLDSSPLDTGATMVAKANARFTALTNIVQTRLANRFKYWGASST